MSGNVRKWPEMVSKKSGNDILLAYINFYKCQISYHDRSAILNLKVVIFCILSPAFCTSLNLVWTVSDGHILKFSSTMVKEWNILMINCCSLFVGNTWPSVSSFLRSGQILVWHPRCSLEWLLTVSRYLCGRY